MEKQNRTKQENNNESEAHIISDSSKSSQAERKENLMDVIRNGQFEIELTAEEKEEPYFESQYHQPSCPDQRCDGNGYLYGTEQGKTISYPCTCIQKTIMTRKLVNANFDKEYFDAKIDQIPDLDELVFLNYFKPHRTPKDRIAAMDELFKTTKGKKKVGQTNKAYVPTDVEEANLYIHMYFEVRRQSKLSKFMTSYAQRLLELYQSKESFMNLVMFGDSGKGKSFIACAMGRYFLENNQTVSYTKMESLMQIVKSDQRHDVHPFIESMLTKDLVIFDELGGEYQKDNGYVLKQIQNLFKSRQENNKPTIIITNLYPHELQETYDSKIMSLFNGSFLMVQPFGTVDLRTHFREQNISKLDFIE